MNYSAYSVSDFLNDESFQDFALNEEQPAHSFWTEWLKNNPHKQSEFQEAIQILQSFSFNTIPIDFKNYNKDFVEIQKRLDIYNPLPNQSKKRFSLTNLKIAVSVIVLLSTAGLFTRYFTSAEPVEDKEITYFKKSTPRGVKSTVMLPDGSKVKLNAESELQYNEDYDMGERTVFLKGEAFFEVAENKEKPFTVYSGDISTTALGTSFNIKAYPAGKSVEVYLVTGKVKVEHNIKQTKIFLNPNQGVKYNNKDQDIRQINMDIGDVMAWKSGILRFNKSNFTEVVQMLSRWYNVEFEINGGPQESWSLTGEFKNESLENVLNGIGHTTDYAFEINENKVIMNF